ncbi:glycoside hydrolase family 31 protein [Streptomyces sp. DSM 42041]|uniref:Glycoside hydrolase family 31 protein n=1 Tax=Streptomyces hazeniae TaxID=3075538 RepID=A0ABU2NW84_9ACTN|nr:TIM-barrel domain-containing protein [Streptomyces sp. DSM 42041]MDT0381252.1 glycoside hydrolase family 31 protein [Streptomyces sp. DSM 42041]
MKGRDRVRSAGVGGVVGMVRRWGPVRSALRRGGDAGGFVVGPRERARVPGEAVGAEPRPGGGLVRFERSALRVRVAAGGAVFCGWDEAAPEPSYALGGRCPEADTRAVLEPDTDGGWRVVSERLRITVSRRGAVEVGTPGGVVLRRDAAPRWWETEPGGGGRWVLHSRVSPDARFFGLGGPPVGPRLPAGAYRLWNAGVDRAGGRAASVTMPVQLVVADVGCHLVFHDATWDGEMVLRDGEEGAGSGHDRDARCEVRMSGGPLRYWVITGTPARLLRGWASLTGTPARPPVWALGYQHVLPSGASPREVREAVSAHREHGLPLHGVHLAADDGSGRGAGAATPDGARFREPGAAMREVAGELRAEGVRLAAAVRPEVWARPGGVLYEEGTALGAFVRDGGGGTVRRQGRPWASVYPDFTDSRVRKWWGGLYAGLVGEGFSGACHQGDAPASPHVLADADAARGVRHDLEGRGGAHLEAHNVYGLAMAQAGWAGLLEQGPQERPLLVSKAGWAGSQRYGGVSAGAPVTDWHGLRASLAAVLGLGLCGVPFAGPEAGAWDERDRPSPELLVRRFQLAAYLPLFRGGDRPDAGRGAGDRGPRGHGREVLAAVRAAAVRREELVPYLVTLAHLARRTGAPYVRPLWWHHCADRALRDCGDAFLLGDALLVAPVLEAGLRRRAVRLPRGCWYDTATGVRYDGGRTVVLDAPLERVPVLARAGAAVPVAVPDGGTALEVWRPPPGRTGSGLLIREPADAWARPEVERLTVSEAAGRTVVTGEDGHRVDLPVRVRG